MSANKAWIKLLTDVLYAGETRETRGTTSLELLGYQSRISMERPVVTVLDRKLGYKFQAGEAWWILTGDNRVETIKPYSKAIAGFSDNGATFFGAYGPKITDQLGYVVDKLVQDQGSRQAVINIWREKPPKTKDVPCTLSLQFILTPSLIMHDEFRLDCVATMRSSDSWLGWPYDVFNFTCVSAAVGLQLRLCGIETRLGDLILTCGSQHVYDTNVDKVRSILRWRGDHSTSPSFRLDHFDNLQDLTNKLKEWADGPGSLEGLSALNSHKRAPAHAHG